MRLLFVDDEQSILDGITRSLFHLADVWDVSTAISGAAALELMSEETFDVVITDMRMPVMNGAQLLGEVRKHYPDSVRIVLSGHTEEAAAVDVANLAHQFLTKPCQADHIEAVVQRAFDLRSLLRADGLRTAIGQIKALPPVPRLYQQLSNLIDDPRAGVSDVAALIEGDPAMSAKVLQLVNSSFFGIGRPITRVQEAVTRLGLRMLRTLVLQVELFEGEGSFAVSAQRLEQEAAHAHKVAMVATRFFPKRGPARDNAFMAGMLHDVGRLVLLSEVPDWEAQVQRFVADHGVSTREAERQLFGGTHAEIGGYLLGVWGLPNAIVEAVAFHPSPRGIHPAGPDLLAALHVADAVVSGETMDADHLALLGPDEAAQQAWLDEARQELATVAEGGP